MDWPCERDEFSLGRNRLVTSMSVQKIGKLSTPQCAVLVCDLQERFKDVITGFETVVDTSRRMIRAATSLDLPCLVTEQYPKALGTTVQPIKDVLSEKMQTHAKLTFSMDGEETSAWWERNSHVKQVLLCGIEAHVCVLQTALDLLERGLEVHVVVDGVSSQRAVDREVALQRVTQSGAFLVTSEMAMFQLMQNSKHASFKAISALCKEARPESAFPGKL